MPEHAENIIWRFIDQRLHKQLVFVFDHEIEHGLYRVLVPLLGHLFYSRVIPVNTFKSEQITVVWFFRIGGRRTTTLEGVVARLHTGFSCHQGTPYVRVSKAVLLFAYGQISQFTPSGKIVKWQVRLDGKQCDDRFCRCLAIYTAASGNSVVQVLHL